PPAGGALLLLVEHRSDYVRFHAWQSALVFSAVFVVHLVFSWSALVSWVLFVGDVVLIGWLAWRAWVDGGCFPPLFFSSLTFSFRSSFLRRVKPRVFVFSSRCNLGTSKTQLHNYPPLFSSFSLSLSRARASLNHLTIDTNI